MQKSIHVTNHITHNDDFSMLNTLCRPSSNGSCCANCEMQSIKDHGINYVKIRPKTNEDHQRSQIAHHVNITPINDIGICKIDLYNDRF